MAIPKANSNNIQQLPEIKDRADFQLAAAQAHDLASHGLGISVFVALLLLCALIANTFNLNAIWVAFFCNNAAALVLFGAGLRSAYDVVRWRQEKAGLPSIPHGRPMRWLVAFLTSLWSLQEIEEPDHIDRLSESVFVAGKSLVSRIGIRPLSVLSLSLFACLIVYAGWSLEAEIGAVSITTNSNRSRSWRSSLSRLAGVSGS